jgi:hypothetical protein
MTARLAIIWILLAAVLVGTGERIYAGELEAWLDRTRMAEGETVRLTLEAQGQQGGRPDTSELEQDFEVLGLSTGSRLNIVNGQSDIRTSWTLTLSPRRSGTLTIPALRVGQLSSAPLTLEVTQTPVQSADSGADVLVESEIEPDNAYVQAQLLYTVRLLYAVPVTGGRLSEPEPGDTLVQRLGEDREYATTRNGRRYQVIERRYALFPQTSGALELPAPVFDGEVPDTSRRRSGAFKRFFGNDSLLGGDPFEDLMTPTRRVRVRGEPATVEVRPRPAAAGGDQWLPAAQVELKGDWQPAGGASRVGEPVTLTIDLRAQGLTGGQLPDVAPQSVEGFRVYPDRAQRETNPGAAGVAGHLSQKVAFIPERSGELALPDIEVHWWDTGADTQRVATIPGRVLDVAPAVPGNATTDAPVTVPPRENTSNASQQGVTPEAGGARPESAVQTARPEVPGYWQWISAALAAGWLLTVLIWWWRVRHAPVGRAQPDAKVSKAPAAASARKQFIAACRDADARAAQRALLAWASAHWHDDPPRGLEALSRRIDDPEARAAIAELNRALYSGSGQWNGARLAELLQQLPEPQGVVARSGPVLAPLYPGGGATA